MEPQVGIHSLLAHLSPVWKELCVKRTLTKEIFKSFLFERLRKAVNNAHFIVAGVNECESSSSTSHLLQEQQDRLSDSMDDFFYQTAKDSSFFSGLRRCKRRCASSDKSLSKKPAKHCRNSAKILFAGRSPRRWITHSRYSSFHFKIFVFAWAICIINVTDTVWFLYQSF